MYRYFEFMLHRNLHSNQGSKCQKNLIQTIQLLVCSHFGTGTNLSMPTRTSVMREQACKKEYALKRETENQLLIARSMIHFFLLCGHLSPVAVSLEVEIQMKNPTLKCALEALLV